MSGLVQRRGYLCHKVAFDGTAFFGSQCQFRLLAHFVFAHPSRCSRAMRDDDGRTRRAPMRDDDGRTRRACLAQGSGDASGETHCDSNIFNFNGTYWGRYCS
jgi:hypothetical protein